jgi:hypothetical protein
VMNALGTDNDLLLRAAVPPFTSLACPPSKCGPQQALLDKSWEAVDAGEEEERVDVVSVVHGLLLRVVAADSGRAEEDFFEVDAPFLHEP